MDISKDHSYFLFPRYYILKVLYLLWFTGKYDWRVLGEEETVIGPCFYVSILNLTLKTTNNKIFYGGDINKKDNRAYDF